MLKPRLHISDRGRGWNWFCGAGWLLALLLGFWAAPRIYHRLILHLPGIQLQNWTAVLAAKEKEVSSPWRDPRPLIVFAGDSEIEFGNWYDLFGGNWAVRNCGLARAKIADVTRLVAAIGPPHPQVVVLMCGINNLGHRDSRAACVQDYAALLAGVNSQLQPKAILVLSVMPVRESAIDRQVHEFNLNIARFNAELADCCLQHRALFLNVTPAVAGANGGLADDLTPDGLHLNPEGYRRLAQAMAPQLDSRMQTP